MFTCFEVSWPWYVGKFSVSIRLLLTPSSVCKQALLVVIAHFSPYALSVVGFLVVLLTKIATILTQDLL